MSETPQRRRRRLPEQSPEKQPCTVCGMPSTSHWRARAAADIFLCDPHLEVHRDALKKAEYTRAN